MTQPAHVKPLRLRTAPKFVDCIALAEVFDHIGRPDLLPAWCAKANEDGYLTVTLSDGLESLLAFTPEGWRAGLRGDFLISTSARHLWLISAAEFEVDYEVVL